MLAFNGTLYGGCHGPYTRLPYDCDGNPAFRTVPWQSGRILKRSGNGGWSCAAADNHCGYQWYEGSQTTYSLPEGLFRGNIHGFCC